jgi:hypothetical protein
MVNLLLIPLKENAPTNHNKQIVILREPPSQMYFNKNKLLSWAFSFKGMSSKFTI